jgi:hypothetical protein
MGSCNTLKTRRHVTMPLMVSVIPPLEKKAEALRQSRDKLIERANVAHCSGGFAEAVLLRRRYAVMKEAARARRR